MDGTDPRKTLFRLKKAFRKSAANCVSIGYGGCVSASFGATAFLVAIHRCKVGQSI
jgi:hypothetical protein